MFLAGILLDATVVRALLVPALVALFGRWNWWLPRRPGQVAVTAEATGPFGTKDLIQNGRD